MVALAPAGLDLHEILRRWPALRVERFDTRHFSSSKSYSHWLLTPELYERFEEYDFLLLAQTDAVITDVPHPDGWNFDYAGARWSPKHTFGWLPVIQTLTRRKFSLRQRVLEVGNGGLSIRKTAAFRAFTSAIAKPRTYVPEDIVISYYAKDYGLSLASPAEASKLFMETEAAQWDESQSVPNRLGFHALEKHNLQLENRLFRLHGV